MKFEVIDESANFFVQVQWNDEVEVPVSLEPIREIRDP